MQYFHLCGVRTSLNEKFERLQSTGKEPAPANEMPRVQHEYLTVREAARRS